MLSLGDVVRVRRVNTFGRPYLRKYMKKVGQIEKVIEVQPSKRVPDGRVYLVQFKGMRSQKFIARELKLDVDIPLESC